MNATTDRIERVMRKERDYLRECFFDNEHAFFKENARWLKEYHLDMMKHFEGCEREVLSLMFRCGFISMPDYIAGYDVLYKERRRCQDIMFG